MPFESKSQQRFMFAAEARNEVPKGTASRWAHETKNMKKLPEKKRTKKADGVAAENKPAVSFPDPVTAGVKKHFYQPGEPGYKGLASERYPGATNDWHTSLNDPNYISQRNKWNQAASMVNGQTKPVPRIGANTPMNQYPALSGGDGRQGMAAQGSFSDPNQLTDLAHARGSVQTYAEPKPPAGHPYYYPDTSGTYGHTPYRFYTDEQDRALMSAPARSAAVTNTAPMGKQVHSTFPIGVSNPVPAAATNLGATPKPGPSMLKGSAINFANTLGKSASVYAR